MDFPLLIEAKNLIIKVLKQFGIKVIGNNTHDILQSYFNLKHKLVKNRPRSILMSNGLVAKAQSLNIDHVLTAIENKFKTGQDINPFLSKRIFRSDSHDYLLNDWQIHHLHLNERKDKPTDYFNARSKWLLFVHVTEDQSYFIDIRHHGESHVFAQRDLLRIVRDNWPDLNRKFLINEQEMEIYPKLDEEGITILRKKGYMFFTQVDKHVYAPGLGSSLSGFSTLAGLHMNEFHRELFKIHSYVKDNEKEVLELLSKNSGISLTSLNLTLAYKDWTFYVFETNSKQFINFDLKEYNPHAGKEEPC